MAFILRCGVFFLTLLIASAYFTGEHVDTMLHSTTGRSAALKAERPLFGLDSSVRIPRNNSRFSLSFEEGFHQLSWFDSTNLGKLRVSFIYSKSGEGAIHSVSSEPIMKSIHEQYSGRVLEIEYIWIEEAPIDLQSGAIVMLLGTLVLSLIFLFQACGLTNMDESVDDAIDSYGNLRRSTVLHKE